MTRLLVLLLAAAVTVSAVTYDLDTAPNSSNLMILSSKDIDVAEQSLNQNLKLPVLFASKDNLCLGKIENGDLLLAKATHIKKPCPNKVHVQDIILKGRDPNIRITAIQMTEMGAPQDSTACLKEGGVGKNFVVIQLQSAKGGGYHYISHVWGIKLNNNKKNRNV